MGGLLNPGAVTRRRGTFNTNSGGPSVNLTPEQQARISGSGIGSALGVAPPAGSNPLTLQQFSIGLNDGSIKTQDDLNALIYERGYSSGDNVIAPRNAKYAPTTSAQLGSQSGGGGSNPSNPALGGGSDGSNFGSAGAGYNPGGATRYDSAGNRILGTAGGKNIITGGGVDRSAGVNTDPMSQWSQFTDPNYFLGRAEDVRQEVERSMQGSIDAINQRYEGQVRREEQAGQEDLARQRSMNLRAGLGGSDFGAANKAEVRNRTSANVRDIQANQDIAVGNAIMQIEQVAQNRITMEQNAMQNAFSNTIAVQGLKMQMQTQAKESIKELGAAGLDMETIKQKDPALYQSITSAAGIGEVQAEYLMNSARKAAQKIDYTYELYGDTIVGVGQDPLTGEIKQVTQKLAVPVPANYSPTFAPDGTLLMVTDKYDPTKPMSEQVVAVGNYAKPETGGGYNNTMLDNERALMGQFKGEPIVKQYNDVVNKAQTVQSIIDGGMGGPGDLAIVFEFMKALDPSSVVRESEYETASKSGNIFSGTWTRFNKGYFDPQGGILPEQVKTDFMKAINVKMAVAEEQYDNVANEYSQIASRQGLDPRNVVIGYGNAFNGSTSATNDPEAQAAVSAPIGSIVYLNGKPYRKLGADDFEELSSISAPK